MSRAWVAGSVRARLLASRRVGTAGAAAVAHQTSLAGALRQLADSPYGRELGAVRTLDEAQRAVAATLLWHLRVLAGWLPPPGAELLRAMAAWFEIANVLDRLAYLAGRPHRPAFDLSALATAWPRLARTGSSEAIRAVLAGSRWGDPGGTEPAVIATAMRAAWAQRIVAVAPEASIWARSAAALLLARTGPLAGPRLARVAGVAGTLPAPARPADVAAALPVNLRWALDGIDGPEDLWHAETRWWSRVESDAARLAAARRPDPTTVVGVVALLAADAWRVRAALAAAALGPAAREAFDAVA
jgi:hypothetical protein